MSRLGTEGDEPKIGQIYRHRGVARGGRELIRRHPFPLLLACPGAAIHSFDYDHVRQVLYEETEHTESTGIS